MVNTCTTLNVEYLVSWAAERIWLTLTSTCLDHRTGQPGAPCAGSSWRHWCVWRVVTGQPPARPCSTPGCWRDTPTPARNTRCVLLLSHGMPNAVFHKWIWLNIFIEVLLHIFIFALITNFFRNDISYGIGKWISFSQLLVFPNARSDRSHCFKPISYSNSGRVFCNHRIL